MLCSKFKQATFLTLYLILISLIAHAATITTTNIKATNGVFTNISTQSIKSSAIHGNLIGTASNATNADTLDNLHATAFASAAQGAKADAAQPASTAINTSNIGSQTVAVAGSCTGNAATATLAATASSLNSQAFASNAEAQAFSVTNKAISPATLATALGGANQSIAASGYQKLPGGLIIQWGSYTSSIPLQSSVTITLPTAFPNAIFIVIPTPTGSIDYSNDNAGFSVTAKSTTQFTAKSQADNAMGGMDWISIGY